MLEKVADLGWPAGKRKDQGWSGVTGPGRRDRAEDQVGNQAESPVLRGEWGKLLTGLRSQVVVLRPSGFLPKDRNSVFQGKGACGRNSCGCVERTNGVKTDKPV